MAELDIDIDCLDDFMDVIEKDLKIESLLVDLDLELDLEATSIYFNVSAIPKSLYEPIPYVHKVSFIFLALDMGLFDNNYREDVHRRNSKVVRDRKAAWDFILTWSDALFHRQFFIAKVDFLPLCEKLKNNYPGTHATGFQNYTYAQQQGYNSNPKSGPITMEIKLAITLRLLRGACALDMIWYGVQIQSVAVIFSFENYC
jgi:hypothetical protein